MFLLQDTLPFEDNLACGKIMMVQVGWRILALKIPSLSSHQTHVTRVSLEGDQIIPTWLGTRLVEETIILTCGRRVFHI